MTRKFDGVLFDLDGTLLDTLQDIGDAMNRALAARGFPVHPIEAYKMFVGDGARRLAERAAPADHRHPDTVTALLAAYREEYRDAWNVATRPYEGIAEMLDALSHRDLRLGILSNKPHRETVKCACHYFPKDRFTVVLGQREHVARKPDPSGALEAAHALGVEPRRILYVGDTATDMETARAAGMFPLGVTWGFRPESELIAHGAQVIIRHPGELCRVVDGR